MAIDVLSDRSYNGVKESVATAKTVATKTSAKASANISTADKTYVAAQDAVVLTDSAKTLAKAKQIAKDSSGIDSAKVELEVIMGTQEYNITLSKDSFKPIRITFHQSYDH